MTKFGDFLLENAVQEWAKFYVNYKRLKKLLKVLEAKHAEHGDTTQPNRSPAHVAITIPDGSVAEAARAAAEHSEALLRNLERMRALASLPSSLSATSQLMPSAAAALAAVVAQASPSDSASNAASNATIATAAVNESKESKGMTAAAAAHRVEFASLIPPGTPCMEQEVVFFKALQEELDKVNSFFAEREAEFLQHANVMEAQLRSLTAARQQQRRASQVLAHPTGFLAKFERQRRRETIQQGGRGLFTCPFWRLFCGLIISRTMIMMIMMSGLIHSLCLFSISF